MDVVVADKKRHKRGHCTAMEKICKLILSAIMSSKTCMALERILSSEQEAGLTGG